jgi:hypothetical protein
MTVTFVPSLEYIEAISKPITPAPITVIVSGTLESDKAPVDDINIFSSILNPLGHDISDPVAINIFSDSIIYFPFEDKISIFLFPKNFPEPFKYSTLFFLNKNSIPSVSPLTTLSLAYYIPFQS